MSCVAQETTLSDIKLALAQKATIIEEAESVTEYQLGSIMIYLIVDVDANRMRLMSPVVEEQDLNSEDLKKLMSANFDRALDAKYALSDGVLWSVFAHPLQELYKEQAVDALYQVRNLVSNYGSTYTSTNMVYGSGEN